MPQEQQLQQVRRAVKRARQVQKPMLQQQKKMPQVVKLQHPALGLQVFSQQSPQCKKLMQWQRPVPQVLKLEPVHRAHLQSSRLLLRCLLPVVPGLLPLVSLPSWRSSRPDSSSSRHVSKQMQSIIPDSSWRLVRWPKISGFLNVAWHDSGNAAWRP